MAGREMVVGAADVPVLRRFGKALGTRRINQPQPIRLAVDTQLDLRSFDRPAVCLVGESPLGLVWRIRHQQPRRPRRASADVDANHARGDRADVDRDSPAAVVLGRDLDMAGSGLDGLHPLDPTWVAGLEIGRGTGWSCRLGYQPRWIHSSRCGRSRPIVVGWP